MNETKSTCCYCGVGCGVIIESDTGSDGLEHVVGVRGDPDHPANFGRLCSKGSTLHLTAASSLQKQARLNSPRIRRSRSENFSEFSWAEAIETVANRFAEIIQQHGPDSVGIYVSGQILTEDYYIFNKLAKGLIGTNNIDTNSRLCMSSAVAGYKQSLGSDAPPCCYEDINHAEVLFITGSNMAYAHPILYRQVEDARQKNPQLKIIVVDPRRTDTAQDADLFLQILPGSDIALYHGMLHIMLWENWINSEYIEKYTEGFEELKTLVRDFTPKAVSEICGISESDLITATKWFACSNATLSFYCQGLNQSSSGTAKNTALINLHLATGHIGKQGAGPFSLTGQPNAMGGREVGGLANLLSAHRDLSNANHRQEVANLWGVHSVPDQPGLSAIPMFEALRSGKLKAIWIVCTNPAQSMPDQNAVREALEAAELVVVQDAYAHTATTEYAHLVLPATTWAEKVGTVTNSERRISKVNPAVQPYAQSRHDWQIALDIGLALEKLLPNRKVEGVETLFPYKNVEDIWKEHRLSTAGRDLDITGLSYQILEERGPQQWPMPKDSYLGKKRLYSDGKFARPNGKAKFIACPYRAPAEVASARFPFILTTGRLRDQWHGMSRTGTIATLFGHSPEPCIEISPRDALRLDLDSVQYAHITSKRGSEIFPIKITDSVASSQAFIAMHWGSEFVSGNSGKRAATGVNGLTNSAIDPDSAQPELKYSVVKILKANLGWHLVAFGLFPINKAFAVQIELRSLLSCFGYASCVLFGREQDGDMIGVQIRVADENNPLNDPSSIAYESYRRILSIFSLDEKFNSSLLRYQDKRKGTTRLVRVDSKIMAVALAGPIEDLSSYGWLRDYMERGLDPRELGRALLLPIVTPPSGAKVSKKIVCNCFNVTVDQIEECIKSHTEDSSDLLSFVQKATLCGTNCGSCKPELRQLLSTYQVDKIPS